jgi:hypothetical protein
MPRTSTARLASASSMQCPSYPADLLPQLQSTLAALADIELRYHSDQEQLQGWGGPKAIKMRFAGQIAERYQRERAPFCSQVGRVTASDGSDGVLSSTP